MNYRKQIKKRTWIERNPRIFVGITTVAAVSVLFSRLIYDSIFTRDVPKLEDLKRDSKRYRS